MAPQDPLASRRAAPSRRLWATPDTTEELVKKAQQSSPQLAKG